MRSLVQEREAEVQAERELEEMRSSRRESELRQQLARRQVAALEEEEQQKHQQQDEDGDGDGQEEEVDSEAAWTDALLSEVASGAAQCGACARVLEAWACRTDPSPPRRLAARTRCLNIREEVMLCFFSTYEKMRCDWLSTLILRRSPTSLEHMDREHYRGNPGKRRPVSREYGGATAARFTLCVCVPQVAEWAPEEARRPTHPFVPVVVSKLLLEAATEARGVQPCGGC